MNSLWSFSFLLLFVLSLASCKNFKKFGEDRKELNKEKLKRKELRERAKWEANNPPELIEEAREAGIPVPEAVEVVTDSLYLSYERTACYGRCPAYKMSIYNSGYAEYEGANFVDKIGKYGTVIDDLEIAELEKKITDIYFFQLENKYDDDKMSDLPAKIIEVCKPKMKKKIVARVNVPSQLIELFDDIDELIDRVEWTPVN